MHFSCECVEESRLVINPRIIDWDGFFKRPTSETAGAGTTPLVIDLMPKDLTSSKQATGL